MFDSIRKSIQEYLDRVFDAEKFEKYLTRLAKGRTPFTTNSILKFATFWSVILMLVVFAINQQEIYVSSNAHFLAYLHKSSPNLYHAIVDDSKVFELDEGQYSYIFKPEIGSIIPLMKTSVIIFVKKLLIQKLTFEAFGIIIQVICLVRFIILAIRFNVPTSVVMTAISFCAAYAYYVDLQNLLYTGRGAIDKMHASAYIRRLKSETLRFSESTDRRKVYSPVTVLFMFIRREMTYTENGQTYYTDPFSLMANWFFNFLADDFLNRPIPENMKWIGEKRETFYKEALAMWYYISGEIFLPVYKWLGRIAKEYKGQILFLTLGRRLSKYMPYLLRWHWHTVNVTSILRSTFIMIPYKQISFYLDTKLGVRYATSAYAWEIYESHAGGPKMQKYFPDLLLPVPGKVAYFTTYMHDSFVSILILELLQSLIFISLIFFYANGAFHAAAGQYYFIPLITPNIELHVGERKDDSLYCGGQAAWQDMEEDKVWRSFWHGVFGRGIDKPPVILIIYDFIKDLFVKFFRIFRR